MSSESNSTSTTALVEESTQFESGGQQVEAFLCQPEKAGPRGSVIVIHEIFGVTSHIEDVARRVARAGYTALAPNYFSREGAPPSMADGFDKLRAFVGKIPDAQVLDDSRSAMAALRARPESNGKVGVIGFCWGGYYAMLAAEIRDLNAAIAYYGRIRLAEKSDRQPHSPMDQVERFHAPLMGHFGGEDRAIPTADAEALAAELKKHKKTGEIFVYEGAGHAFNNDTRESYHAPSAELAWRRTLDWLQQYVAG